jgi:hypothetical protein
MVFPYDGRFARMNREKWFKIVSGGKDIGLAANDVFPGQEFDHNSVGGCVMWNKEAFIRGGMENENFISFGPEDCERHDRFKMLGFEIIRIPGNLFHMDHYKGPNSSNKNPYFRANHIEIEKIRSMTKSELLEYVNTWPWRHPYTNHYRRDISKGSIRSAKIVMDEIDRLLPNSLFARRVIDVGGGCGDWNNKNPGYFLIDHNIQEEDLLVPKDHYVDIDLSVQVPDADWDKFELCICLEVAEHLPPSRARDLIDALCRLSDIVLFSAAIPDQGGTDHLNEQWETYWAEMFKANGFGASKRQPDIRNNPEVELWYRQNIVLYERGAKGKVVDFVLPEYYIEIVKWYKNKLEKG